MSRRVCTKRSSIFLMSCEKKPMTFHPCLVSDWGDRKPELAAAFDRQRVTARRVPRDCALLHRRSKDELLLLLLEIVGLRECRPPTSKSESDLNTEVAKPINKRGSSRPTYG